jgi:hypothetical protein
VLESDLRHGREEPLKVRRPFLRIALKRESETQHTFAEREREEREERICEYLRFCGDVFTSYVHGVVCVVSERS